MNILDKIKNLLKNDIDNETSKNKEEKVSVAVNTDAKNYKDTTAYKDMLTSVKGYKDEADRITAIPEITYEERVYEPVSDEELKKTAENELYSAYADKKTNLTQKKDSAIEGYNKTASDATENSKTQKSNISSYYDNAEEKVSNDALKRGLQRSSIVSGQINKLNENEIADLISVDNQLAKDLNEISSKIAKAETEYATAVQDLDFKKAVEIDERVNELKTQEEKKRQEIDDYNKKMLEEVNKSNEILNKDKKSELLTNRRNLINEVLNYFYAMPKEDRYNEFIGDSELIALLGDDANYVARYLK